MKTTQRVRKILSYYEGDSPGTKTNVARILMHGKLGGSGKMVILPVDQGFEHGPARSFAPNPPAYDPAYHAQLALDAGLNAYATPLGMIESIADTYAPQIPLILKLNSANSLSRQKEGADQAITGSVKDALRLGCAAVGLTIYPGSDAAYSMFEEAREVVAEAKAHGLASVIWSYPRGGNLSKEGETAIDVVAYSAHMAALLGAHIIKVKLPTEHIEQDDARKAYDNAKVDVSTMSARVEHVMQAVFNGKRLVVFSGGTTKGDDAVYEDARAIRDGGGNGSIIGRNTFQRDRERALAMLNSVISIYQGRE